MPLNLGSPQQRVGIIGAGWAGLAAAVTATQAGHAVTVWEMAPQPGGRAREIQAPSPHASEPALDNGQHLLIGAYRETLRLMAMVGVPVHQVLWRTPLHLVDAHGSGLMLPPGSPTWAFLRGVWGLTRWSVGERLAFMRHAASWRWRGFRCAASLSVGELTRTLPARVRDELIDPLCVAALNTPSGEASAQVFLTVLRDALSAGPGSADLLFPRQTLSALWPTPATRWLQERGAELRWHHRVQSLTAEGTGWRVDGNGFDQVILATTPGEAARLCQGVAPLWARQAQALQHEPIATVYVRSKGTRLITPMVRLDSDEHTRPAQFVLDHGHWGGPPGLLAMVVSGASPWMEQGHDALTQAAIAQLTHALGPLLRDTPQPVRTLVDKRATFRCTTNLQRPPRRIADGLQAAGDYVEGPYPATLEGAMLAGVQAARGLTVVPHLAPATDASASHGPPP